MGIGYASVLNMIRNQSLPSFQLGNTHRVRRSVVQEVLVGEREVQTHDPDEVPEEG